MTLGVRTRKESDEARPPAAEQREELATPELLAGYLAKIRRERLLTHQEEISLSRRGHAPETKGHAKSW